MADNTTVTTRIELDHRVIGALEEAQRQAIVMTADAFLTELVNLQVMPKDTGNLQDDSTYVDESKARQGIASVVTAAPQAARLYFHPEYDFYRGRNSNAGAGWFDEALEELGENWFENTYAEMMRRTGGIR